MDKRKWMKTRLMGWPIDGCTDDTCGGQNV